MIFRNKSNQKQVKKVGYWFLIAGVCVTCLPAFAQDNADPFVGMDDEMPAVEVPVTPAPDTIPADNMPPMPEAANNGSDILQPVQQPDITRPPPLPPEVVANQGPDVFYDANNIVPRGEMGRRTGPRKMNPLTQPGSRLMIITEKEEADTIDAQLTAANRAKKLGRYESAVDIYDLLYAKNKRDPRILMGRAVAYQHLGKYETAIQAYQEFLDLKPHNIEAQINMLGLMSQKYPAVALRRLLDLREKNPDNAGLVAQVAFTQAKLGSLEEAIRYLGIAASMEPRNANHVFNMAVIADRMGDTETAVTYYETALETDTLNGGGDSIPRGVIYERLAQLR